ncbi:HAMP domain-containing sensor histidine kinase [Clostridiaceae bacterium M8S5]|nr:HAMP domain-containing sensor histidine kinase [Clostridiaceae bacterium M8S5]
MNKPYSIFIIINLITIVLCLLIAIVHRNKVKKLMQKLNQMLDKALDGSFEEDTYDESFLSAIELKLSRFVKNTLVAKQSINNEKKNIKALVADISHQTKTPIANISLYSQLLSEQELDDNTLEFANQISRHVVKLDFLIQSLLKSSRLETDIISVRVKDTSVFELIKETANRIKSKASEKDIYINIIGEECIAKFDKKWTEEALYNVLDNAVKYSPLGSVITVSIIVYDMFCRIDIIDKGIGINNEDINAIFKRFYRCKNVSQYEGVGLGLYIARTIITKQGGYIKVKSSIDRGSKFSIFIPK